MSKNLIRLYGSQIGWGSSEIVFNGMREGILKHNQLAGTFIYNSDDETSCAPDSDAPVCISCPPPRNMHIMSAFGHKQRWFVLAPNSTKVSKTFLDLISEHTDGIITPSHFGANALRNSDYKGKIRIVRHGVSENFKEYVSQEAKDWLVGTALYKSMRRDPLSLLHLAESSIDRKGTWPLVQAFVNWNIRAQAHLTVVVSHQEMDVFRSRIEDKYGIRDVSNLGITIMGRVNLPPYSMGAFYACFDYICQPSRSEGFGLVPLEALACGIPVIITIGHGHMDWCEDGRGLRPGIIPVIPGGLEPALFDGEGMAAIVEPEAIRRALDEAERTFASKKAEAIKEMDEIRREFSWENVTKEFCKEIARNNS